MKSVPSSSCEPETKGIWAKLPERRSFEGMPGRYSPSMVGA